MHLCSVINNKPNKNYTMAVTNKELIAALENQCIEEGLMQADESLHTFQVWKSMGYSVCKGEKALISGTIWKYRDGSLLCNTPSRID